MQTYHIRKTWPAALPLCCRRFAGCRNTKLSWLASDLIAGVTLAAYAIPVSLAYATLAGLPPYYGIYCYLVGGVAYAILGTSRQLAVGPTSAIAMLVGTTVAGMAGGDPERWAAIAALTAFVVAALSGLAWMFRLSGLVSFISQTILTGFKAGAALTIGLTQLPKLFGVPGGGDNFFERAWILATQLGQTNMVVLTLGVAALALLILGDRFFPGRPDSSCGGCADDLHGIACGPRRSRCFGRWRAAGWIADLFLAIAAIARCRRRHPAGCGVFSAGVCRRRFRSAHSGGQARL